MNKDYLLLYLRSILGGMADFSPLLLSELIDLIARSGYEEKFFTQLTARLNQIRALGALVFQAKEFERIDEQICSMHCTGAGYNIRILFVLIEDCFPILLVAFYERGGKRKTDYTQHIPAAHKRLEEYYGSHSQ